VIPDFTAPAGQQVLRIGVTGHRTVPDNLALEIDALLSGLSASPAYGVSCLAEGADRVFAEVMLGLGNEIETILPCHGYENAAARETSRAKLDWLTARSSRVDRLPFPKPSESAYVAGGVVVVERCDVLVAVWDGKPARGPGGTADIVGYARSIGRDVKVISIER